MQRVFRDFDRWAAGLRRGGVVHVGAHDGQEVPAYRAAGFERLLLIEPQPERARALEARGLPVVGCAVADRHGTTTLYVTASDQRSSILRPRPINGKLRVLRTLEVPVAPLRELVGPEYNVLVLDCQGSELEALRSADLGPVDLVICEVNTRARGYEGQPRKEEVVAHLAAAGLLLQALYWHGRARRTKAGGADAVFLRPPA